MFEQVACVEDCGNGYGWSIVDLGHTYELAVLQYGGICYNTHITSDVERGSWLRMCQLVDQVKALPNG